MKLSRYFFSLFHRPRHYSTTMSSNESPRQSPSGPFDVIHGSRPMSSDLRTLISMMEAGISPRELLGHFAPSFNAPQGANDIHLWSLLASMIEPPKRKRLSHCNSIGDAISLISKAKKIMVLSGAGISTSAGIPDFRSRNGIYVQIHAEHGDLQDPKLMFDIEYFRSNPRPFYQFAKALYPGQYKPTIGHKFIKCIEEHNKLLRNFSQNIDTLEKQAGIKRVIECHGSFATASCTSCKFSVDGDVIKADILAQKIPLCPKCHDSAEGGGPSDGLGVMKPDIVFFGEQLREEFHRSLESDKDEVDLLIVIGSSLKVRPVALIPKSIPNEVPQILINKEPLDHMQFDIELLGNCDDIIQELCLKLGGDWVNVCEPDRAKLNELSDISAVRVIIGDDQSVTSDSRTKVDGCQLAPEGDDAGKKGESNSREVKEACPIKEGNASEPNGGVSGGVSSIGEREGENMIEKEKAETVENNESKAQDERNSEISEYGDSSDEDWEDIQILSPQSSIEIEDSQTKVTIELPKTSYLFLRPNRYVFQGAELNKAQFEKFTKDSQKCRESNETTATLKED